MLNDRLLVTTLIVAALMFVVLVWSNLPRSKNKTEGSLPDTEKQIPSTAPRIVIYPGSRSDAHMNLDIFLALNQEDETAKLHSLGWNSTDIIRVPHGVSFSLLAFPCVPEQHKSSSDSDNN
jgi:hypothetical protein